MDLLSSIVYIVLFVVLMIFVFSMGLLTPISERKDILSVLAIGFIVGLVGGAFFLTPIYQDIPAFVGSVQEALGGTETMTIEISPSVNYTKVMDELQKKEGVISVINKGIYVKTDPFPEDRKKLIEDRLVILDENFKSFHVNETGEIDINFTNGYNPKTAIKKLSDWLMYTGGINLRYSLIQVELVVKSGSVDEITQYLHSNAIVVSSVSGSVQNAINNTEDIMVDDTGVILISGVIGVIVALISIYYDNISSTLGNFHDKVKRNPKIANIRNKINLDKLKRKNKEDKIEDSESNIEKPTKRSKKPNEDSNNIASDNNNNIANNKPSNKKESDHNTPKIKESNPINKENKVNKENTPNTENTHKTENTPKKENSINNENIDEK